MHYTSVRFWTKCLASDIDLRCSFLSGMLRVSTAGLNGRGWWPSLQSSFSPLLPVMLRAEGAGRCSRQEAVRGWEWRVLEQAVDSMHVCKEWVENRVDTVKVPGRLPPCPSRVQLTEQGAGTGHPVSTGQAAPGIQTLVL